MKNIIFVIIALALNLNFAMCQTDDHLYDYYDDYEGSTTADSAATDFPTTNPPTTTRTTTTTARAFVGRRVTRPLSGVVHYNRRFNTYNENSVTEKYQGYQQPTTQITSTSTQSPAGINRNTIDLERSENRKNYAQSRVAEDTETEDDKSFSRRYARFLFNQRTG